MYCDYFGLSENPFSITPDPRYLYMSKRHQEALAHLLFGIREGGGFVQLTGEVGTGKTTLVRALLEQVPGNVDVALILNPRLTAIEFVASICDDLKVEYPKETTSLKALIYFLNEYLIEAHTTGRRVLLIIDEAQNFHVDVLEQIRLLTNLETTKQKLLQIILVGQPELRDLLSRTELRQLAQRITARYHLVPMTGTETKGYIQHRLKVAGVNRALFIASAIRLVQRFSGGVPRVINIICDRALLGAYSKDQPRVTAPIVKQAAAEVRGDLNAKPWAWSRAWLPGVAMVMLGVGVGVTWQHDYFGMKWIGPTPQSESSSNSGGDVQTSGLVQNDSALVRAAVDHEEAAIASTVASSARQATADSDRANGIGLMGPNSHNIKRIVSVDELYGVLDGSSLSLDLDRAFASLFASWGLDYDELVGVTGCERAITARLHCHWSNGSWEGLLSLNRPAIIWLEDVMAAQKRYIVITGSIGDDVVVDIAGKQYRVATNTLKRLWSGAYLVLWKPPALDVALIKPGDRGEIVVWLRRNLDKIQGLTIVSHQAEVFDQGLIEQVKAFQRSRSLKPDGLVGEKTLIHLNTVSGDSTIPVLSATRPKTGG